MRDLTKLVCPFPNRVIHTNPSGGGNYVAHPVVEQRLLDVVGPVRTELVEIVRGYVAAKNDKQEPLANACVAVVLRMTVSVDGQDVLVEEVGDCEDPHFWKTDGARLKDAFSDAYKRCALRIGVGLHLWAGDDFYLFDKFLTADNKPTDEPDPDESTHERVMEAPLPVVAVGLGWESTEDQLEHFDGLRSATKALPEEAGESVTAWLRDIGIIDGHGKASKSMLTPRLATVWGDRIAAAAEDSKRATRLEAAQAIPDA